MPPKYYYKNEYIFKENHVVLNIRHNNIIYKTFIDYDDYESIRKYHWFIVKFKSASRPYIKTKINKKQLLLHRFIMKPPVKLQVDHINRNPLDNRRLNLRIVTQQENLKNRAPAKNKGNFPIKNISIQTVKYKDYIYKYYKVSKNGINRVFKRLEDAKDFLRGIS